MHTSIIVFKPFNGLGYLADMLAYYARSLPGAGVPASVTLIHVPDDGELLDAPVAIVDGIEYELRSIEDVEAALAAAVRSWLQERVKDSLPLATPRSELTIPA